MFTVEERDRLSEGLISRARDDKRIVGAAVTGSASIGKEDRWSDIDLAFGVAETADLDQTIADWTEHLYANEGAAHHLDVAFRSSLYRVFFLGNSLQVDLAFSPSAQFGALGPTFQLLFGAAQELAPVPGVEATKLIGWGWLHAIHARSSLARGRHWQAEHMISGIRDRVLALACLHHGLPASEGRGMDDLPEPLLRGLSSGIVRSLDRHELTRAFRAVTESLITETQQVDPELATRLTGPLRQLIE